VRFLLTRVEIDRQTLHFHLGLNSAQGRQVSPSKTSLDFLFDIERSTAWRFSHDKKPSMRTMLSEMHLLFQNHAMKSFSGE
jgi:hypothetical protein